MSSESPSPSDPPEKLPLEDPYERALHALETSNSLLQRDLSNAVEKKWALPRTIFGVVSVVLTLFFGVNLYTQAVNMSGISTLVDQLESKICDFEDQQNTTIKDFETRKKELLRKIGASTSTLRQDVVDSLVAANRIITLVGIGQSHLYQRHSPQDALVYAKRAAKVYESYMDPRRLKPTAEGDEALVDIVRQVGALLFSFYAESAWQGMQPNSLKFANAQLKLLCENDKNPENCWNIEYRRYDALMKLIYASSFTDNDFQKQRREQMTEAQTLFIEMIEQNSNTEWALLFYGLICLDISDESTARKAFGQLTDPYDDLARLRLASDLRARVELGRAGAKIVDFILNGRQTPLPSFDCQVDLGSLGRAETELIEVLLSHLRSNVEQRIANEEVADQCEEFCAQIIRALQSSCREAGGCQDCEAAVIVTEAPAVAAPEPPEEAAPEPPEKAPVEAAPEVDPSATLSTPSEGDAILAAQAVDQTLVQCAHLLASAPPRKGRSYELFARERFSEVPVGKHLTELESRSMIPERNGRFANFSRLG